MAIHCPLTSVNVTAYSLRVARKTCASNGHRSSLELALFHLLHWLPWRAILPLTFSTPCCNSAWTYKLSGHKLVGCLGNDPRLPRRARVLQTRCETSHCNPYIRKGSSVGSMSIQIPPSRGDLFLNRFASRVQLSALKSVNPF